MLPPGGSAVIHLQCKRHRFSPYVGKIPWRRKWQPVPVSLPGKFHAQRSLGKLPALSAKYVNFIFHRFFLLDTQSFALPVCIRPNLNNDIVKMGASSWLALIQRQARADIWSVSVINSEFCLGLEKTGVTWKTHGAKES